MKILMLWHDYPSPFSGGSLPAFNLLKNLGRKHNITLLCFKQATSESIYINDLNQYCEIDEPVNIPFSITTPKSLLKQILYTIIITLSPQNLFSKNPSFFNMSYSPKMQTKIKALLFSRDFDLIYSDGAMAHYVQNTNLPKVVHSFDCLTEQSRQKYLSMRNFGPRIFWWLQHLKLKRYEGGVFKKFDACIVVSTHEQETLQFLFPEINAVLVPNGVDSEFFKPFDDQEECLCLIFVGGMSYQPNIDAMLYFCSEIYPRIKADIPDIKLYIIGRDPAKEIRSLSIDTSITVTGFVEDVRPYLTHASVVLAPFVSGTPGIKNKVLEAMAMAKPVVSTSIGIKGIVGVTPGENIVLADDPDIYAKQVIKLLNDKPIRQMIGQNARKFIEKNYSWEKTAEMLNDVIEKAVSKYANR